MPNDSSKYLIIIDPSTRHPEQEVCQRIRQLSPLPSRLYRPALPSRLRYGALGLNELEDLNIKQIAGLLILGGGASPNDSLPWQTRLINWLTKKGGILESKCPILGVCYGHQLLGYLAGGQIRMLWEEHCEKGLRSVSFTQMTLGLKAQQDYSLVVSHREGLISLPENWHSLTPEATIYTDYQPQGVKAYEMIMHQSKPWWGVQAHIDATPEFLIQNHIKENYPRPYAGETMIHTFLNICHGYSKLSAN